MRRVLALVLAIAGGPALAHPHVFVETGLTLHLDPEGRLRAVGVVWAYDELTSLLALEDLGLDPDGDGVLTEDERAVLSALAGDWDEGSTGDLLVRVEGRELALSGPEAAQGDLRDGRVVFSHSRVIREPLGGETSVSAFDPTYYIHYQLTPAPQVAGPETCRLRIEPADLGAAQRLWDQALSALTDDEVMNEDNLPLLGEAFADRVVLTCG